ncbi:MAG: hypothetical protein OEQ53_09320, partial [Saprospiraceae bacterium]|nr:hypothetical protein [Saprospiraceae bacterium]
MKKNIFLVLLGALFIIIVTKCEPKKTLSKDPSISFAHGVLIGPDGIFTPDAKYLLQAQDHYISKYQDSLDSKSKSESSRIKRSLNSKVTNKVLANALYLDWIIDQLDVNRSSILSVANNAMRWYYVKNLQKDPVLPTKEDTWSKGIKKNIAIELEDLGMKVFVEAHGGSPKYVTDCRNAGVPIPDKLFGDPWENLGFLSDQMAFPPGTPSELRMFISNDPPGFCLSLTRHDTDVGDHYDLICFGIESNNACFFESDKSGVTIGNQASISDLRAGEDASIGAPCTRCHLGENPYIVHPADEAFATAASRKATFFMDPLPNLNGSDWYKPFKVDSWPINPPPFENFDLIPSERKCSNCHTNSYAGRFADLTQVDDVSLYSDYCTLVFPSTIGENSDFGITMPMGDTGEIDKYITQINHLKSMCDANPDPGKIVDNPFDDDEEVMSPPHVIEPVTQCAKVIYVDGFNQNAAVTLVINNVEVATVNPAVGYWPIEFLNFGELNLGDTVQVTQSENGFKSPLSMPAYVTSHSSIYPDGLPAPVVEPTTIYECSNIMAVLYDIPGLVLEVKVNGGNPVTAHTFKGYKPVKPGKVPFVIGDSFTAQVFACDDTSRVSNSVSAQAAPSHMPHAIIKPESLFAGQEFIDVGNLTYGSLSIVADLNTGLLGTFTSPLSWWIHHLPSPISESNELVVAQKLCDETSEAARSPKI